MGRMTARRNSFSSGQSKDSGGCASGPGESSVGSSACRASSEPLAVV